MYTKRPLGGGSTRSPLSTSEGGSSSSNRGQGFLMDALVTVAAGVWGSLPSHSYSFKSVSGRMSHLTYECLLLKYIKCKNVFSEFMKNGLPLFQHTSMQFSLHQGFQVLVILTSFHLVMNFKHRIYFSA